MEGCGSGYGVLIVYTSLTIVLSRVGFLCKCLGLL
jgi:hypothetical protein